MEKSRNRSTINTERKAFQGVLNILDFNRHYYYFGFLSLIGLVVGLRYIGVHHIWILIAVFAFAYGMIAPLLVSYLVYDAQAYYNLRWISSLDINGLNSRDILNIHAGLDETSAQIERTMKAEQFAVINLYDPVQMSEKAIHRALAKSEKHPNERQAAYDDLPLPPNSQDLIFILSAAHELRSDEEKVAFFKECRRVLRPEGRIIMTEHLRNLPNCLAFTAGVMHFFGLRTWQKTLNSAGLEIEKSIDLTPFMNAFKIKMK